MATPLSPDALVRALRAEGVKVVEYPGWRTNRRPASTGAWGPVNGVMIHHTVTSGTDASVRLCFDGRSDLPGPLCHGVIAKDGTVYLVGSGRANHAGRGDDDVLAAVVQERDLPPTNENNTDGNARFYGFEAVNLGDGKDPWPAVQLEAIERAAAALCRAHGWSARSAIGHKEWTNTKIDPRGFEMTAMRQRIADRLKSPAGSATPSKEDTDVQLTDKVNLNDWVPKAWPKDEGLQDGSISVQTALGSGYAYARQAKEEVQALRAEVAELRQALAQQAASGGLTNDQVAALATALAPAIADTLSKRLEN
ncbi:peptidoglycan recognition family protein [Streptomyces sp. UH6]|uniref:peptidoglycan recognition protein family protein n=1 Tax=Streptomyces sp. UH6 TaxID=2748379 RepID=UPI0015D47A08|nr:peptidoglycan recognition family protein [Streptomyces sp. UH6]NYV72995.1 N-acetylmuramoyl-L-alanine amidase [Streptomyces sp. UH6]